MTTSDSVLLVLAIIAAVVCTYLLAIVFMLALIGCRRVGRRLKRRTRGWTTRMESRR